MALFIISDDGINPSPDHVAAARFVLDHLGAGAADSNLSRYVKDQLKTKNNKRQKIDHEQELHGFGNNMIEVSSTINHGAKSKPLPILSQPMTNVEDAQVAIRASGAGQLLANQSTETKSPKAVQTISD